MSVTSFKDSFKHSFQHAQVEVWANLVAFEHALVEKRQAVLPLDIHFDIPRLKSGTHLLAFEHVLVEVLLQLLVGQVDTELFEVVRFELFKAVNVQHSNHRPRVVHLSNALIHLEHQKVKEAGINRFGEGVTIVHCCLCGHGRHDRTYTVLALTFSIAFWTVTLDRSPCKITYCYSKKEVSQQVFYLILKTKALLILLSQHAKKC